MKYIVRGIWYIAYSMYCIVYRLYRIFIHCIVQRVVYGKYCVVYGTPGIAHVIKHKIRAISYMLYTESHITSAMLRSVPRHAISCYAVLCCAVLCYATPCSATLCYAMLCCAVLCCAMLRYAVLCCAVP